MPARYFSDATIDYLEQGSARLTESEAHHFLHVMRGEVGDRVVLFDGSGFEFDAVVTAVSRKEVELSLVSRRDVDREPAIELTIGVAMPKGDRQKVLVEKLAELGVTKLLPLNTERSVAAPKASGLEKLRRIVVEASKQCGRNRLMRIGEPTDLARFLLTAKGNRLIAHPGIASVEATEASESVSIAIGPEGGFTDAEVAAATDAGWGGLPLGKSILRIETAAIASAARFTTG